MTPGHALLLDTHVVILMATEPERLPGSLLKAIEKVETRHVSAWEIQIKHENMVPDLTFPWSSSSNDEGFSVHRIADLIYRHPRT